MKQKMTSKYIFRAATLIVSIVVFISCLGGSDGPEMELSRDAQIYTFSIAANHGADSLQLLPGTRFTIDQVNGRLFNQVFLPYRFSVDSVVLNIGGNPNVWMGLSEVEVHLINPDTSFTLGPARRDSIYVRRLDRIKTTAADGVTTREYSFQLNIFQQDPYIISWVRRSQQYIASPIEAQRTIALNGYFITYYLSNNAISAAVSSNKGESWTGAAGALTGLPNTTILSSIISVGDVAFAIDEAGIAYRTLDDEGLTWTDVATDVKAIFGLLPTATGCRLLIAVNDAGTLRFALTDDFSDISIKNALPADRINYIPMRDFSSVSIDKSATVMRGIRNIVLTGGATNDGLLNNDVWIFEQFELNEDVIRVISHESTRPLQGSSLFFYDDRLYALVINADGENDLIFSRTHGLFWADTGEDQVFPPEFITRTNATVFTDDNDYIWIFGGQATTGEFSDTWRGRLNRLDYEAP
jgi:hypothetical protein